MPAAEVKVPEVGMLGVPRLPATQVKLPSIPCPLQRLNGAIQVQHSLIRFPGGLGQGVGLPGWGGLGMLGMSGSLRGGCCWDAKGDFPR